MAQDLKDINKRDVIGMVLFGLVGVICGLLASEWSIYIALVCIVGMTCREIFQMIWNHYKYDTKWIFEWTDVLRYYMCIMLGAIIGYALYIAHLTIIASV